jgi:TetR/AcrR family transcriptional regulator, regulator of cefoperazone and chloramphenicol sensitivity
MGSRQPVQSKAEETKQLLVRAATITFAHEGFHAASLKKIAQSAGVNQALIAYHFGNKEGLYLAVFESIVAQIQDKVGSLVGELQSALGSETATEPVAADPEVLRQALFSIVDAILELLSSEASREWALLITREQAAPTEAFEVMYRGFMGRTLGVATRVIRMLKPGISADEARLSVLLIMGQILVFRVSRTTVLRHMGWQGYGEDEIAAAKKQLHRNISTWLSE